MVSTAHTSRLGETELLYKFDGFFVELAIIYLVHVVGKSFGALKHIFALAF